MMILMHFIVKIYTMRWRIAFLNHHLYANGNQNNSGDDFWNLSLESLCRVPADFKAYDAHHEAGDGDGGCREDHVRVDECKRNPYGEGVDACGYRQKKYVRNGKVRCLRCGLFAAVVRRSPDHAESEDAENAAGDCRTDRFEPAFRELPEKIPEQGHPALENSEGNCLEHGSTVTNARF